MQPKSSFKKPRKEFEFDKFVHQLFYNSTHHKSFRYLLFINVKIRLAVRGQLVEKRNRVNRQLSALRNHTEARREIIINSIGNL